MSVTSSFAGNVIDEHGLAGAVRLNAASTRTATVRVPASTSNLGSGFDCVGLAIDRWLVATVAVSNSVGEASDAADDRSGFNDVTFERSGTLQGLSIEPSADLVYAGFKRACEVAAARCNGRITFSVKSDIPVSRGLGSSAAAIVAGAMLANEALSLALTTAAVLKIAAEIEGHPDNVAAALHGGAILTVHTASGYWATPLTVAGELAFIIVVPGFECDTIVSRRRLPDTVPYADAVLAVSKSAALVKGLETGDTALLSVALDDVIHVPYRSPEIAGFETVRRAAIAAGGVGATLSGSGSAMLAIAHRHSALRTGEAMVAAWRSEGIDATAIISYEPAGPSAIIQQEIR